MYNIVEQLKLFIDHKKKLSLVRSSVAGALIGMILIAFNGHHLPENLLKDSDHIKIPPKNFSEYYQIYQELKQPQVPLFIINAVEYWTDFTPYLYMRWMGTAGYNRGYDYGFELVNAHAEGMHASITIEDAMKNLKRFIEMNPKGKIILDDRRTIW